MTSTEAEYMRYLNLHHLAIMHAYKWMHDNMPDIFSEASKELECTDYALYPFPFPKDIGQHDLSKYGQYEFSAYARKYNDLILTNKHKQAYNYALLHHHHNNAHHWQHWVLIEGKDTIKPLKMPLGYILEMVADWWSFSWMNNDIYEIFTWYVSHQDQMILHRATRQQVEKILTRLHNALDEAYDPRSLPQTLLFTTEDTTNKSASDADDYIQEELEDLDDFE